MDDEDITLAKEKVEISTSKRNYFYHKGEWVDLNGDGRKDFITARSNAHKDHGELVWFEHPEGGLDVEHWTEHVITSGPDVNFEIDFFDNYPGEVVVFAAEFFNQKLSLHRVSLTDGSLVESRTIDGDTILDAYTVALVDLNADGQKQLLVNNHETSSKTNGIWAYTLPEDNDLMNGEFTKMTIATGFKNAFSLTVPNMSPGFPYAVWPNGWHENERAHIFVAGDGDHKAHVLYPSGENSADMEYVDDVMASTSGTVAALAFSDLDEDGWTEVWMPIWDNSTMEVFKISGVAEDGTFEFKPIGGEIEFDYELDLDFNLSDIVDFVNDLGEKIEDFAENAVE
jgi:hypothetical protein